MSTTQSTETETETETRRVDQSDKAQFLKILLAVGFATTLVTANLTATKLAVYDFPIVGETTGSVAAFMIGVSFLFSDLLCELYGKRTARYVVNASIGAVALAFGLVAVAVSLPASGGYELTSQFNAVFGASYPILVGSVLSLLVTQNLDVSIFHAVKSYTGGGQKWARNTVSTATSQLLDTALFTVLAFWALPPLFGGSALPWSVVFTVIFAEYTIKLVVALLDTSAFYVVSGLAERSDGFALTASAAGDGGGEQ